MFSKFKIEKAPSALYRREPSHFEVEQSAISLPLLEAYDQRIRHLCAENEQLRAEKVEHVKIINGQATELAERRAEVSQLRQELQLLRHEVSQHQPQKLLGRGQGCAVFEEEKNRRLPPKCCKDFTSRI